jgi:Acyl-CoA dehydrogenases
MSVIAVEEISRVDASFGVFVDVQNTLVNNAVLRWGNAEQKKKYLPKLAAEQVGAYALSKRAPEAMPLRSRAGRWTPVTTLF